MNTEPTIERSRRNLTNAQLVEIFQRTAKDLCDQALDPEEMSKIRNYEELFEVKNLKGVLGFSFGQRCIFQLKKTSSSHCLAVLAFRLLLS